MRRNTTPEPAEYERYAEVARHLATQESGLGGFMWAELALLWETVAQYRAAEEAQVPAPQLPRKSAN